MVQATSLEQNFSDDDSGEDPAAVWAAAAAAAAAEAASSAAEGVPTVKSLHRAQDFGGNLEGTMCPLLSYTVGKAVCCSYGTCTDFRVGALFPVLHDASVQYCAVSLYHCITDCCTVIHSTILLYCAAQNVRLKTRLCCLLLCRYSAL